MRRGLLLFAFFAASVWGQTSWVTNQSLGTPQSNFSGCVGINAQTAGSSVVISQLGRWVISGNGLTHPLRLMNAAGSSVLATCTVNTSGATAAQYLYCTITPQTVGASTGFYVTSEETNGGDQWYDDTTTVTVTTSVATATASTFATTANCATAQTGHTSGNFSYGPVSFKYGASTSTVRHRIIGLIPRVLRHGAVVVAMFIVK